MTAYLSNVPWYIAGALTTKLLNFVIVVMLTSALSLTDMGYLATFEAFARVAALFMSLYLNSAFLRFYNDEKLQSSDEFKSFFSTHLIFSLTWSSFAGLMLFFVHFYYLGSEGKLFLFAALFIICTEILNQSAILLSTALQAELKAKRLTLLSIASTTISVIFTYICISEFEFGLYSRLVGLLCVSAVQLVYLIWFFSESYIAFKFSRKTMKKEVSNIVS